jgi:predicted deacylase
VTIKLDVLSTVGLPTGDSVEIVRRRFSGGDGPRVAVVAGIRGDTPEGVRVAHLLASALEGFHESLGGTVDVYPCVNPLAAHRGSRHWPFFDQDLNRRFPGRVNGHAPDRVAWDLVQDLRGAAFLIEVRGAHPAFSEAPQAHVRSGDDEACRLARLANVNVVWSRRPGPAAPSTLAYQLPGSIVLEGGRGNRLTAGVGLALRDGVLNLLNHLRVVPDEGLPFHWAAVTRPETVEDDQVHRVRTVEGGLFLPEVTTWDEVASGACLGRVVDPINGQSREDVLAPAAGRVMAVREQPVVFPGSMVARVVEVSGG